MARLGDPETIRKFKHALGLRNYKGYVSWKRTPGEWLRANFDGYSQEAVAERMLNHIVNGGKIDQVAETRQEYSEFPFHYDFRLEMEGRLIYIETVLHDDDPEDPTISIVSVHDA